ncbi:MAG TPA: MFS transporter [Candidatus Aquabacterium excrementipullorum]|nr:MFS transporter [Candidatus Aquabacterium excrementipullorum]
MTGRTDADRARGVTRALFFCSGLAYAVWGVYIPQVAGRFSLSPLTLTGAMLAVALGAMAAMGPAGRWIGRAGSARACLVGAVCMGVALTAIPQAPGIGSLLLVLVAFGAGNGLFDTAMNAQAVTVEREHRRPLLSSMHGLFSVGGIVGAVLGSAWLSAGWAAGGLFLLVALVAVSVVCIGHQCLLADQALPTRVATGSGTSATLLSPPAASPRPWLPIGILAFCGLLIEGAMYDWTTLYMQQVAGAAQGWAGAGYGGFSAGMTLGRFTGDALRARRGEVPLLHISCALAGLGFALVFWNPAVVAVALGFGLIGLGCANMVPILFAAGARARPQAPAEGIALVGRLAYVGFMVGPVLVGAAAHGVGLRGALSVVALAVVWIAWRAAPTLGRRAAS